MNLFGFAASGCGLLILGGVVFLLLARAFYKGEIGPLLPEKAFPIPARYTNCTIEQLRRSNVISLTVRTWYYFGACVYVLETDNLEQVQSLVEGDGFSPRHDAGAGGVYWADADGVYYFYKR